MSDDPYHTEFVGSGALWKIPLIFFFFLNPSLNLCLKMPNLLCQVLLRVCAQSDHPVRIKCAKCAEIFFIPIQKSNFSMVLPSSASTSTKTPTLAEVSLFLQFIFPTTWGMFDSKLTLCVFPFPMLHWFQKHKDQLWGPMGSASSRVVIFVTTEP